MKREIIDGVMRDFWANARPRAQRHAMRRELERARGKIADGMKHLGRIRELIEHRDQYTYKQWETTQQSLEWAAARLQEVVGRMAELGPSQVLEEPPRGREKHYRRTGRTIDAEYVEPPTIFDGFTFEERRA